MKMELRHLEVRISFENTEPCFHGEVTIPDNFNRRSYPVLIYADSVHFSLKIIATRIWFLISI